MLIILGIWVGVYGWKRFNISDIHLHFFICLGRFLLEEMYLIAVSGVLSSGSHIFTSFADISSKPGVVLSFSESIVFFISPSDTDLKGI